jgi:hypothetical protein
MAGFGLTGDTITASGTLAVDTTIFHTSAYNNVTFAAISHTHSASDIISGTLPIVRGGTGLSGIGAIGQVLRVAASGTGLEYFTPIRVDSTAYHTIGQASDYFTLNTLDGRKDTVSFPKDTQYVKNPLYSDNDTLKFHSDSLTSVLKYSGIDSSAYDDNTLIPKSYLNDRISQVTSTGITRTELQDTAAAIRSDISTGSVQSVTGLNTDNTDPANPVVKISVDGSTITGSGTPADPLVSAGGGGTTSIQTQTVSGSTTLAFTSVPASYSDYEIFRNGVRNYPVTDYTTSGNNITIPAVDNGDVIILQRIK